MKNFALLLLAFAFWLNIGSASATIFRVNNGVTENIPNKLFNQIQTAINHFSVQHGDTLMVEGSATGYSHFACDKRLVIIGPGYFLGQNPGVNGIVTSAKVTTNSCYFNAGSQGSTIVGMEFQYTLYLQASSMSVLRCKGSISFYGYNATNATANCRVIGSYCDRIEGYTNYNSTVVITNCIILQDDSRLNYLNYDNNVLVSPYATYPWNISAGTFRNNILVERDAPVTINSPTKLNNLAPNQQFGSTNGNIAYDSNNLFVGGTSSDGKYQIRLTSPYISAGTGGSQPGIFGGSEPYRLSGIPPIPIIYELTVPGTGSTASGLNINIKIRNAN